VIAGPRNQVKRRVSDYVTNPSCFCSHFAPMISRLSGDCSNFAPTRRPSDAYRGEPAGRASLATEDKLTTPRGRQPPKGRLERRWHVDGPAGAPPLSGRVIERDDVVLSPHLQVRHGLSKELLQHMAAVESLAAAVAE
jgi:hypothetical protein